MLGFVPIFILLGAAIAGIILQFVPRGTGVAWFASVLFAISAWGMVIILRTRLPLPFAGQYWISLGIKSLIPAFQINIITWPFALTICSLVAGVLLVSSARIGLDSSPREWVGILLVGIFGYLGVIASNILTAIFVMGFIDVVEIVILLYSPSGNSETQSQLKVILWRIIGLTLFLVAYGWQYALSERSDEWLTLQTGPVHLILFACAIRLGLFPTLGLSGVPRTSENGFYVLRSLIASMMVFAIIVQLPFFTFSAIWKIVILVYLLITATSAAIVVAVNQNHGLLLSGWQIAAGSLICAAYVLGYSPADIALSTSIITLGAILFLEYPINLFSRVLGFTALIGFSGLPFTPNILGFSGFGLSRDFPGILFLIPVTLLLFSSIRILLTKKSIENTAAERWTGILSPAGLIIPIISVWVVFLNGIPGNNLFQVSIPALLAVFVCIGLLVITKFNIIDLKFITANLFRKLSDLVYSLSAIIEIIRKSLKTAIQFPFILVINLFEGEGGILWAALSLILIMTIVRSMGLVP